MVYNNGKNPIKMGWFGGTIIFGNTPNMKDIKIGTYCLALGDNVLAETCYQNRQNLIRVALVKTMKSQARLVGIMNQSVSTWRIIPFSKWLITMVSKSPK